MRLSIVTFPDPVLYKKSKELKDINEEIKELVESMIEIMYEARGIGLAAPQIGKNLRIFVFDLSDPKSEKRRPHCLINPVITAYEGEDEAEEGCLSIPNVRENIKRWAKVEIKGVDINGNERCWEASGLLARVFQHEIDHLDGILFIDRLNPIKRRIIKKRLLKEGAKK